jgi:putative FmdB family regulatory protein
MPIYEYECEQCQQITESWQHLNDAPLTTCPECHGELKKLISHSSFQLKGGGWYADGYCNSGNGGTPAPCKSGKDATVADTPTSSACPKSKAEPCCGCASA